MSVVATIPMFIVLMLIILLPFIVGFFVYRDARQRNMNAILWAIVAALAPAFIGLIVYLLVRGNYMNLRCPQCNTPVMETYVVCPKCGAKLRPSCPNCKAPVEPDWKVCPRCTTPLPEYQADIQTPVRAKDRTGWKILLVILLVPLLLILLAIFGLMGLRGSGSVSMQELNRDEYFAEMESLSQEDAAEKVQEWLDSLNQEGTRAHALRYDYFNGSNTEYYFLVYVPGGGNSSHSGLGQSTSIFGTTVKLELEETGNDGTLFSILSTAEKVPNLKITLGGERIPCYVDTVDFNPTVYYIVPQYDELDPDATDFFMPERISVVQIVGNSNVGVVEIQDDDVAFDILVGIDSAPYLDLEHDIYGKPDGTGGYDFKDGFEIRIEYQIHNELLSHADMITCLAFEQDGSYYLIDDRPDNGRIFRQIDEAFYLELGSLFEELS
ncbi:Double zinc ribbon [uncultured Flavonifractor sp.]|nr:Double zinc ribbon [uncultured Flavonifractor sp.]